MILRGQIEVQKVLEQIDPWQDAYKRFTWKPIVEEGDRGVNAAKFSGMPWLAENEPYPHMLFGTLFVAIIFQINIICVYLCLSVVQNNKLGFLQPA
ncbi:hypothetical protein NIES4074_47560 [Cylindrospermum sp. NIES-4074]|nr:hypothetical protein NIES4074_47560 [Cylindrospermum sp. NIES-4074]